MTLCNPVQHCNSDQIRGPLHSEFGFYLSAVIDDRLVADTECFGDSASKGSDGLWTFSRASSVNAVACASPATNDD